MGKKKKKKKFSPYCVVFSLFVSAAYNHLSALRLDEGEGKKRRKMSVTLL